MSVPVISTNMRARQLRIARRRFLRKISVATFAFAPIRAALAIAPRRSLSFANTHTGEKLSTVYFENGAYLPASLQRIDHLLRDYRTGDVHPIDPGVLDIMFDLRVIANHDAAYQVICGYRSPATNALLRSQSSAVAEHSLHMQGRAIDVRLTGFPTPKLYELALQMRRGGVGFYAKSDFVHVDNGAVRSW
jgi:uncharacterized protein YcbK (DUF882 family)